MKRLWNDVMLGAACLGIVCGACCLAGCGSKSGSARGTREAKLEKEASKTACTVVYLVGTVSVQKNGQWGDAEIGDELATDSTVKTGDKSGCELQVGSLGTVKIAANTVVSLRKLALDSAKSRSEVNVVSGKIGCEVRKLGKGERFEVRTQDATCGVRGTKFMVEAESGSPTHVAVKEGRVALMPKSYDSSRYEDLGDRYGNRALAENMMESIAQSSVSVGANQETEVSAKQMDGADKSIEAANSALETQLKSGKKSTVLSGGVIKSLAGYAVKSHSDLKRPETMSRKTGNEIDEMTQFPVGNSSLRALEKRQQTMREQDHGPQSDESSASGSGDSSGGDKGK